MHKYTICLDYTYAMIKKKSGNLKEIKIIYIQNMKLVSLLLLIKKGIYKIKLRKGEESFQLMVKIFFLPGFSQEKKEENPGSVEFQVFYLTNKIRRLTSHLELHRKDYLSQRGLRKILGKRQRLLSYLSKKNGIRYNKLINQLNIRESQIR